MSTSEKSMVTKAQIRSELLSQRRKLDQNYCQQREQEALTIIKTLDLFQDNGYFYAYYPHGQELSLLQVIQWILDTGKRAALPKVEGEQMDFYEISSLAEVEKGVFGIMEPSGGEKVCWEEAVCLTPGVGFDWTGNRIGHGRGYYDRYFEQHKRLIKVGTAYDFQIRQSIPAEKTDIAMDYLLTPSVCKKIRG